MRKTCLALILTFLTSTAWAETIRYGDDHQDYVIHAQGQDIIIEGHHNDVIITGKAGTVTITGHHVDVMVDDADKILLTGHHNDVFVRAGNPRIEDQGSNNDIVATNSNSSNVILSDGNDREEGAGAESYDNGEVIVIDGAGVKYDYDGEGRDFLINGAGNTITIRGKSGTVTINGASNKVHLEEPRAISVSGFGCKITYSRGNPSIERKGLDVSVERR